MTQKECFKCNEVKCLSEFYVHSEMKDGHLNKCKQCTKNDASIHRANNLEKIRAYDRKRGARQPATHTKEYREKYPNKYKAHSIVNRAIKSGKLFKENCEKCGTNEKIHAHHDDYLKPLNIRWLCAACHSQWHAMNGEARNGA